MAQTLLQGFGHADKGNSAQTYYHPVHNEYTQSNRNTQEHLATMELLQLQQWCLYLGAILLESWSLNSKMEGSVEQTVCIRTCYCYSDSVSLTGAREKSSRTSRNNDHMLSHSPHSLPNHPLELLVASSISLTSSYLQLPSNLGTQANQ